MNYCEDIQRSIDYFEQHINEEIDLNSIVRQSCFSTTHFYRIFQALVGETLKDYVRKRRLSDAATQLCFTKKRVIDIALEYGFNSQEVFTRAFSKLFGITPGRYRLMKNKITLFEKSDAYQRMMVNMNKASWIEPRIILDKKRKLLGLEQIVRPKGDAIRKLWGEFNLRKSELSEVATTDQLFGLCEYMPDITDESEFGYIACVEVEDFSNIPKGMITKILAPAKYAVFTHKGSMEELKATYNYIYGAWLPYSGHELAELDTIEVYYTDNQKNMLDIYIPMK